MLTPNLWRLYSFAGTLIAFFMVFGFSILPSHSEQEEMLRSANRLPEALAIRSAYDIGSLTDNEAATRATIFYASGDLPSAIKIFEDLDKQGRLDPFGLEILAHYYGENQQFKNRYITLLRLADSHLNESDARTVAANFEALGMTNEHLKMLEIMRARNYSNPTDDLKLASIYRFKGRRSDALEIYESFLSDDVSTLSVKEIRTLSRLLQTEGRETELPALHENWMDSDFEPKELLLRLSYLLDQQAYSMVAKLAEEKRDEDEQFEVFYETALYKQIDQSADARRAYTHLLVDRFNTADTDKQQQKYAYEIFGMTTTDRAYELINGDSHDKYPFVEAMYRDRLIKEGRTQRVVQLLFSDYHSPGLHYDDRLAIINEIAALNRYDIAEVGYRELAAQSGPDDEAMKGLLFSWKKLGRTPDFVWMGQQMFASDGATYDAWNTVLLQSASPAQILDWLDHTQIPHRHTAKVTATKIKVSMWESDSPRLKQYIRDASRNSSIDDIQSAKHLQLACATSNGDAAFSLIDRLDARDTLSADGYLCAARLFSSISDPAETVRHYENARLQKAVLTFDDLIRFAEATTQLSNHVSAKKLKQEAIAFLPGVSAGTLESNLTRGYLLMDVGSNAEAAEAFEAAMHAATSSVDKLRIKRILMQIYLDAEDYDGILRIK